MFALPPTDEGIEGQSDDRPIHLEGVKKDDFKQLLKLLYPRYHRHLFEIIPVLNELCSRKFATPFEFSTDQWTSVLELSTKWAMDGVRNFAINKLYAKLRMSPHELILLGKKFNVEEFLFVGVETLIRRAKPLDEEDVRRIGIAEVLKIASIRECCEHSRYSSTVLSNRIEFPRSSELDARIQAEYALSRAPSNEARPQKLSQGMLSLLDWVQRLTSDRLRQLV